MTIVGVAKGQLRAAPGAEGLLWDTKWQRCVGGDVCARVLANVSKFWTAGRAWLLSPKVGRSQ